MDSLRLKTAFCAWFYTRQCNSLQNKNVVFTGFVATFCGFTGNRCKKVCTQKAQATHTNDAYNYSTDVRGMTFGDIIRDM